MAAVEGIVQRALVGRGRGSLVTSPEACINLTWDGVEGDRHAGLTRRSDSRTPHYRRGTEIRNSRQVSLVSAEELAVIADRLGVPRVLPEWLGANLTVVGIPHLTRLPASTRLFFPNDAVLVVDGENLPCRGPGKVIQRIYPDAENLTTRFVRAALGLRGIVAWVERPGPIGDGDVIRAELSDQRPYPFASES